VPDAHCDLPLLHGYLPYRPSHGTCEIRSSSPNLWFTVAQVLGFRVTSLRCQSPHFASMILPFCPCAAVLAATPRRCNTLPDVVFTDVLSLPWGDSSYWSQWATPHVFFASTGDTDLEEWGGHIPLHPIQLQPSGWTACSVSLTHCEAGGGDDRLLVARGLVPAVSSSRHAATYCSTALVPNPGICQRSGCSHARPSRQGP